MKITVKTLKGTTFSIECDLSETVYCAKKIIQETKDTTQFPAAQMKLIHSGKVMKDDDKLTEYNIKENDFIVCMITKPPKTNPPSTTTASIPISSQTSDSSTATVTSAASRTTATTVPQTSVASSTMTPAIGGLHEQRNQQTGASTVSTGLVTGTELNDTVRQLCDMGFPEDQVRQALRAAFNNPDRAVEYLTNGIPEHLRHTTETNIQGESPRTPTSGLSTLQALRNSPLFNTLRQTIQANPQALPEVLNQIGRLDRRLLEEIQANQEEFVRMLNEPVANTQSTRNVGNQNPQIDTSNIINSLQSMSDTQMDALAQSMGIDRAQLQQIRQSMASLPPEILQQLLGSMLQGNQNRNTIPEGTHTIQLTQEEAEAVGRLCDLGFDRNEVIQAYLACDKNEALAANLLMDSATYDDSHVQGNSGNDGDDIYG